MFKAIQTKMDILVNRYYAKKLLGNKKSQNARNENGYNCHY